MRKYLIPENGTFYKANLHTHSTLSSGKLSPEEIKEYYKEHGYSILAYTDHDLFIPHNELTDEDFLVLNGYELAVVQDPEDTSPITGTGRKACHMCFIATAPDIVTPVCYHREKYTPKKSLPYKSMVKFDPTVPDYVRSYSHEGVSDMMRLGRENGFFVVYNHPSWSLEGDSDYLGYENMHAMEIVNYASLCLGYPEHNERVYDAMLRAGKRLFCVATDDGHGKNNMCQCYIMVKADRLDYRTVTDAIMSGHFYSSEGPEIKALYIEDGQVTVETSEVAEIRFNTGVRAAKRVLPDGQTPLTAATYELPGDKDIRCFRVTVTDKSGKCAYSNAYFTDEIL